MFIAVAAYDNNQGIGYQNKLPWTNTDLKYFREITDGGVVIMGRKTYESIGKNLPGRINIVLSRTFMSNDTLVFSDPWELVQYCLNFKDKKLFVIGGAEVYKWFYDNRLIQSAYITKIHGEYKCDTYFPHEPVKTNLQFCKELPNGEAWRYDYVNEEEESVLDLARKILINAPVKLDRTGTGTRSLFGQHLQFDLRNNTFPLMTTRKMFLRGIFEELMLYLRGQTDSKILENKGVKVWQGNTSREFLNSRGLHHLPVGDMGPSYGFLFRHFGAEYKTCLDDYTGQGSDQLTTVINLLKNQPDNRRIIISLWDPVNVDKCPLPPCLYNYQFYVSKGYLSCMMTQRSSDFAVAGGWNIATGALLVYLLAQVCGLKPDRLIWNLGDVHIYNNLVNQIKTQCEREPRIYPKLFLVKKETITDYEFKDLTLLGYHPHPAIEFPVSV